MNTIFYLFLIYLGSCFYVAASYYHLSLGDKWTFTKAAMFAIPLVFLEYICTLNGHYFLNHEHGFSIMQIFIITLCFYFINMWILNYILWKKNGDMLREIICFGFVLLAFLGSTQVYPS